MANQLVSVSDIAKELNRTWDLKLDPFSIERIEETKMKLEVADATSKFIVRLNGDDEWIVIVSSTVNMNTVRRAVEKIHIAREQLSKDPRDVVLEPIYDGRIRDQTYAVWHRHNCLSTSRLVRALQKRLLVPKVCRWLRCVCKETIKADLTEDQMKTGFHGPLREIASNPRLSDNLRKAADVAIDRLNSHMWKPVHILEHSDFWLGNILLPKDKRSKKNFPFGFYVIDWGGARANGYPFLDLARFAMSAGASKKRIDSEVTSHSQIVGCDRADVMSTVVAALGASGMNLEHFPEHRYLRLCENIFNFFRGYGN